MVEMSAVVMALTSVVLKAGVMADSRVDSRVVPWVQSMADTTAD
jgi:hypothetical protein